MGTLMLTTGSTPLNTVTDESGMTAPQRAFIAAYPTYRTITSTCNELGIGITTVRGWEELNPSFKRAFEEAKEAVGDLVEAEMLNRAMAGKSAMSDTLLIFATKRFKPEYREQIAVKHSGAVLNATLDLATLAADDRMALLNLAVSHEQAKLAPPTDHTITAQPTDEL